MTSDIPAPTDRPAVEISPSMRFGRPHIKGISTEAITGMLMAGESPETVCYEYSLTRHELLVACWFEGTHGECRKKWGKWASEVAYPQLAGWEPLDVDAMPMPPTREELRHAR